MKSASALHLAIIPDGNRRWAAAHGLRPWQGHEQARETLKKIVDFCRSSGRVSVLTLWLFSTENWKRPTAEVEALLKMLQKYLRAHQRDFLKNNTRFVHSGRRDRLPSALERLICKTEEETRGCRGFTLHLAIDYGGKDELRRAVQALVEDRVRRTDASKVSEEEIQTRLDHPELPEIDLILRTSGEQRTSNFFLWQSTYAEWIFLHKNMPETGPEDIAAALDEFERRQRRFGS